MTVTDSKTLSRIGQRIIVEYRKAFGNPPTYPPMWQPLWDVKVDRIEINQGARPSVATIWFPNTRWNSDPPVMLGDTIRIRTDELNPTDRTILFVGYATNQPKEFSGGSQNPGAGFERNAIVCMDQRWVLAACSIMFGQISRSPDDYKPLYPAEPIPDKYTYLTGQRLIFNPNGKPNKDPLELISWQTPAFPDMPIFCNPGNKTALFWSARDMVRYILSPRWLKTFRYLPIENPAAITGLEFMADSAEDKKNWGKILNHIVIEGTNVIESLEVICKHIGWNFRLDYINDGKINFIFYKVGIRDKLYRSEGPVISHSLHAPAVGENIFAAVAEGRKILWSMSLSQDIATVINNPYALGAPHRFEFTAELVPAWQDFYLMVNTQNLSTLFYTDAELQKITNPDSLTYYSFYHSRGLIHNQGANVRNVCRKWTLNESGTYTDPVASPDDGLHHYDRGEPFDWATVIPPDYIISTTKDIEGNEHKKRMFARYSRKLLSCLTVLQDGLSSVGIKLEFSFYGTVDAQGNYVPVWQVIPCSVRLLDNECGIYIDEPNIAEIVDKAEGTIASGPLQGIQLNLFTSLVDDRINTNDFKTGNPLGRNRSFKDGEWRTRCRITASVQMDLRVIAIGKPSPSSGSPFDQSQIYDWSDKYGLSKRTASSVYATGFLNAREVDSRSEATAHVDAIRRNNEDMSISGRFTLDRLWLGDGEGAPAFMIGDSIGCITGREYQLDTLTFEGGKVSPEIIQIIYLPETQQEILITRDLRYATNKVEV
jgi:hypothetical protein